MTNHKCLAGVCCFCAATTDVRVGKGDAGHFECHQITVCNKRIKQPDAR